MVSDYSTQEVPEPRSPQHGVTRRDRPEAMFRFPHTSIALPPSCLAPVASSCSLVATQPRTPATRALARAAMRPLCIARHGHAPPPTESLPPPCPAPGQTPR